MNVVVAEKPSVARDLARVLGATQRRDGYLEGDGWRVTWALGHLAELKTPDEYDPALKRWRLETLPFVPDRFELRPAGDAGARRQLAVVTRLCQEADELVCATDAGREGELIFRYLLEIAGCGGRAFTRLWLSSLTDAAIRAAFAARRPGTDYDDLHAAARSRSEADWIVGLNGTRAYTVRYGGDVLWSVGRVQTPVLALIARRDDEIRTFDSEPFWELRTRYRGALFKHTGERSKAAEEAERLLAAVRGRPFAVTDVQRKRETQAPPLLYDLTQLQRDMNLRHGLSAARTLKLAQELYEKKLLTYPRTDCRHLPVDMHGAVASTLGSLRARYPESVATLELADLPRPKRVFDDGKVTDHHAIVPTGASPQGLDPESLRVFDAVARRLVQAFLPDKVQEVTTVEGRAGGVPFRARGVVVVQAGWSALEPKTVRKKAKGRQQADEDDDGQELPAFEAGESGPHEPELHEGQTKPPRPFTENTLLAAMETAGKLVDDEALREALKARGLGTPATRAAILETLIARGYVRRDKKALRVTDLGRYLVGIVQDPLLKSAELTGEWEQRLGEVERGRRSRAEFMAEVVVYSEVLVHGVRPAPLGDGLGACPRCGKPVVEGQKGWGCSAWRDGCGFALRREYRGATLAGEQVRELLARRILLRPVALEGTPRIVCMTERGDLIDLAPPSRDAQRPKARPAGGRRPRGAPRPEPRAGPARAPAALPACPRCARRLIEGSKGFGCSGWREGCRFVIWKEVAGKRITAAVARTLVERGRTRLAKGFRGAGGAEVSGRLVLDGGDVRFEAEQDA